MLVRSQKRRLLLVLLGLVAFSAVAHHAYRGLGRQLAEQEPARNLVKGARISENFVLEDVVGGARASLEDLKGKVVLINFWAGWCAPCLKEMPGLYELHRRFQGRGFVLLAVNMDENPADGLRTLRGRVGDAPFPIYKGNGSPIVDRLGIDGLPFTVVLDREQKIHYVRAGEVDWKAPQAMGIIEGLL